MDIIKILVFGDNHYSRDQSYLSKYKMKKFYYYSLYQSYYTYIIELK
jgi:hypothetical protein